MVLKPQDVVVLLKLVALGEQPWTFQRLAVELSISQSEVHAAVSRAVAARLMSDAASSTGRLLNSQIAGSNEPPPVWPYAEGNTRGYALLPLFRAVPEAARAIARPVLRLSGRPPLHARPAPNLAFSRRRI